MIDPLNGAAELQRKREKLDKIMSKKRSDGKTYGKILLERFKKKVTYFKAHKALNEYLKKNPREPTPPLTSSTLEPKDNDSPVPSLLKRARQEDPEEIDESIEDREETEDRPNSSPEGTLDRTASIDAEASDATCYFPAGPLLKGSIYSIQIDFNF
ncbi:hypothetical protein B9Z55_012730 [Caenorhabditis nigoni]|uniref:Uncharacterized protein n=1 Tax=Caenorhabditis nigoni TaxID=1611254 RepID=A0A2G5TYL8_9PELO|nr:hypothetical protein B9Z55_012730 [Caenorhabditis nigoni]